MLTANGNSFGASDAEYAETGPARCLSDPWCQKFKDPDITITQSTVAELFETYVEPPGSWCVDEEGSSCYLTLLVCVAYTAQETLRPTLRKVLDHLANSLDLKFRVFWAVAPCSHIEVDKRSKVRSASIIKVMNCPDDGGSMHP
jgi:hypothetical protein